MALSDWQQTYDENGNVYYYNPRTYESVWELPQEDEQMSMPSRRKSALGLIQDAVAANIIESPWEEKYSKKYQRPFWKNKDTGETTWKEPVIEITMTQSYDNNVNDLIDTIIDESKIT